MKWRGAALALVVGVVATCGFDGASASAASAAPCAFAPASVAIVVDFGDGSPVSAVCVPAQSSDNGAAALAARARVLGTPAPRKGKYFYTKREGKQNQPILYVRDGLAAMSRGGPSSSA